jgi:hypothetical protein
LAIYGEGSERAALCRMIETFGLQQCVTLAGFTDRLSAVLAFANACVISFCWEHFPRIAGIARRRRPSDRHSRIRQHR